jgi:RIO-like serine/threonine protein kinase
VNNVQILEYVHGKDATAFFPGFFENGISEDQAKYVVTHVIKGLEGFYDSAGSGVVHGDINLFNVMLESTDGTLEKPLVKLIDCDYCKVRDRIC